MNAPNVVLGLDEQEDDDEQSMIKHYARQCEPFLAQSQSNGQHVLRPIAARAAEFAGAELRKPVALTRACHKKKVRGTTTDCLSSASFLGVDVW
jgi:hypothetical protein